MGLQVSSLQDGDIITIKRRKWKIVGSGTQKHIVAADNGQKAYLGEASSRASLGTFSAKKDKDTGDIELYRGHRTHIHAITGKEIEVKAKSPRTRQLSKAKEVVLSDLPNARDTKVVASFVKIVKQYRHDMIDARTFVQSLSKDVWTMLRELKEAGHKDAFSLLDREEYKKTIDKYGAADSVKYLERLEGYLYNEVSEFDGSIKDKRKRVTKREV